jgi:hypothetical protein
MPTEHNDLAIFKAGIALKTNTDNVHDTTPTAAQINAALLETSTGEATPFKFGVINDASGEVNVYLVAGDGTNTFWLKMTKGL